MLSKSLGKGTSQLRASAVSKFRLCLYSSLFTVLLMPSPDVRAEVNVNVELRDSSITPATITAGHSETVRISIKNQGSRVHNFVMPDFYIFTQNLNPGEQVNVSFSPDKTGSFPFYSDAGGAPEPGIRGTIQVHP